MRRPTNLCRWGLVVLLAGLALAGVGQAQTCYEWCPIVVPSGKIGTDRLASLGDLSLGSALGTPVVQSEPAFTRCDCNVIYWELLNDPAVEKYRVDWSTDSLFAPANTFFHFTQSHEDFFRVPNLADTVWYFRVVAHETSDVTGPPSNVVVSHQDNVAPAATCSLSVATEWSTQTDIGLFYNVTDQAGLDSVLFFVRTGSSGDWSVFHAFSASGVTDTSAMLSLSTAVLNEGIADDHFEFYVSGKDLAKAPNWGPDSIQSVGNDDVPSTGDEAMAQVNVDSHPPTAQITVDDSLQTNRSFDLRIVADDLHSPFYSGLDTITLRMGMEEGTQPSLGPDGVTYESFRFIRGLDGTGALDTTVGFEALSDSAIYYFYAVTRDVAGNQQADSTVQTVRVYTGLSVSLRLSSERDPEDSVFSQDCRVDARISYPVPWLDSFVICEDSLLLGCAVETDQDGSFSVSRQHQFADCADGIKRLFAAGWRSGKEVRAEASIVLDTQPPTLTALRLVSQGGDGMAWTSTPRVEIAFEGNDPPLDSLQWLLVDESEFFDRKAETLSVRSGASGLWYHLSPAPERKLVFGKLVDRAENESYVVVDTIDLYEYPHSYPNPFNPISEQANIVFASATGGTAVVLIYDWFGNLVWENKVAVAAGLNDGRSNPSLQWNGQNSAGEDVASGGYICVIEVDNRQLQRFKIAVIR